MEKESILRVSGVDKSFGGLKAVDDVSFEVKQGQIKGLIGPNGAGKTTLFNIITRLYSPDRGTIEFLGKNLLSCKPFKLAELGLSRTFQNVQLVDEMSVWENVAVGFHSRLKLNPVKLVFGKNKKQELEIYDEVDKVLKFLKIEDFANRYPFQVPFGVKRLVELARALVSRPKLLLLDEPAAGLNEAESDRLLKTIFRVWERGVSILLIEHDMEFVVNCSHSIVVMDSGRKIAEGLPSEVINDDRVIKAYLGE